MKEYYAARAKEYDQIYAKPERQTDLRLIEQWLPSRFEGARVLEIAAGTGYWTDGHRSLLPHRYIATHRQSPRRGRAECRRHS